MRDPRIKCVHYCIKPGGLVKAGGLIKAGEKNNNSVQSATSLETSEAKAKEIRVTHRKQLSDVQDQSEIERYDLKRKFP